MTISKARETALDLHTDLANIDLYLDQGEFALVVGIIKAASEKWREIGIHLGNIALKVNAPAMRTSLLVIEHKL